MSVAAVMLVKDEADVIEYTVRHLLGQVDALIIADNDSTDGTRETLDFLAEGNPITVLDDHEVGYWQSSKTTALADLARERGFDWVLPCDADEMWVSEDGRPIREYLYSVAPDVFLLRARLYPYVPSGADDPSEPRPFARIGWRFSEPSIFGKVCCRLKEGLVIEAGNHFAHYDHPYRYLDGGGLRINHYSWRSREQYARKIVNGARAYAATDLPEGTGTHWRMWGDPEAPDLAERAAEHFDRYFFAQAPPNAPDSTDPLGLVYDPALVVEA